MHIPEEKRTPRFTLAELKDRATRERDGLLPIILTVAPREGHPGAWSGGKFYSNGEHVLRLPPEQVMALEMDWCVHLPFYFNPPGTVAASTGELLTEEEQRLLAAFREAKAHGEDVFHELLTVEGRAALGELRNGPLTSLLEGMKRFHAACERTGYDASQVVEALEARPEDFAIAIHGRPPEPVQDKSEMTDEELEEATKPKMESSPPPASAATAPTAAKYNPTVPQRPPRNLGTRK